MGADVLATQGATASATMILAMLNRNNSVPRFKGQYQIGLDMCGWYLSVITQTKTV